MASKLKRTGEFREDVPEFLAKQACLISRAASDQKDQMMAEAFVVALRDPARVARFLGEQVPA